MTTDMIEEAVYALLTWEEVDELWAILAAAGDEEDPIIVKYAEELYLHPADLRKWYKEKIARTAVK